MSNEEEPSFLSKADLRERLIHFANSDGSFASAADLGLLALSVPPRFGGLFVNRERFWQIRNSLWWVNFGDKVMVPQMHGFVCDRIRLRGTCAQCDLYLPGLAAGKRIGVLAYLPMISLGAKECDGGFLLSGNTVARTVARYVVDSQSLICVSAMLKGQVRTFILEGSTLPAGRMVKRGWILYELRQHFVAQHNLLGELEPEAQLSTEKWEAIRWRTDRSAS